MNKENKSTWLKESAAFPVDFPSIGHPLNDRGMTIETYARIQAMKGLLANPDCNMGPKDLARAAIEHADALFEEMAEQE